MFLLLRWENTTMGDVVSNRFLKNRITKFSVDLRKQCTCQKCCLILCSCKTMSWIQLKQHIFKIILALLKTSILAFIKKKNETNYIKKWQYFICNWGEIKLLNRQNFCILVCQTKYLFFCTITQIRTRNWLLWGCHWGNFCSICVIYA